MYTIAYIIYNYVYTNIHSLTYIKFLQNHNNHNTTPCNFSHTLPLFPQPSPVPSLGPSCPVTMLRGGSASCWEPYRYWIERYTEIRKDTTQIPQSVYIRYLGPKPAMAEVPRTQKAIISQYEHTQVFYIISFIFWYHTTPYILANCTMLPCHCLCTQPIEQNNHHKRPFVFVTHTVSVFHKNMMIYKLNLYSISIYIYIIWMFPKIGAPQNGWLK